eukprot:CAMPEP_0178462822 /NCGR_PEP_ID=MMETSP0689_2-20121128/50017_1 /TAXON_ID=160604 /ORGANISM="Amphidinium massartii, Strain CS-259" /LENGTH=98 /DNA_ID=CAMNT_0020089689 /DNA_START=21 /DNA_END=315 /DNA_ORIENTATION=-
MIWLSSSVAATCAAGVASAGDAELTLPLPAGSCTVEHDVTPSSSVDMLKAAEDSQVSPHWPKKAPAPGQAYLFRKQLLQWDRQDCRLPSALACSHTSP